MEIESKNNLARLCILISKLKESNSFNPNISFQVSSKLMKITYLR